MEFYYNPINSYTIFQRFQFPTGWNSTRRSSEGLGWKEVSIPNGMEFYGIFNEPKIWPVEMFQFPTGWNSTRFFFIGTEHFLAFQFPTGWNSTDRSKTFHSQILVSIPNGMEFYRSSIKELSVFSTFQFPTGWNSTFICPCSSSLRSKFQFPTGWNSTASATTSPEGLRVSIPNGMEFYS